MRIAIPIVSFILMVSCGESRFERPEITQFYNLDSLLTSQIMELSTKQPTVLKTVEIDTETEVLEMLFDSAQWFDELKVVRELDLNRPRYVGAIDKEISGTTIRYAPKTGQDLKFESIVYSFGDDGDILSIEGSFTDDKASEVYSTSQKVSLTFSEGLLSAYEFRGFQKMVTRDTASFAVTGQIINK